MDKTEQPSDAVREARAIAAQIGAERGDRFARAAIFVSKSRQLLVALHLVQMRTTPERLEGFADAFRSVIEETVKTFALSLCPDEHAPIEVLAMLTDLLDAAERINVPISRHSPTMRRANQEDGHAC